MRRSILPAVVVLLTALAPTPASACMYAFHHQLLPLGTANERVISIELVSYRTSDADMGRTWWRGSVRLVSTSTDEPQETTALTSPFSFNTYLLGYRATLIPLFALLVVAATQSVKDFTPLKPTELLICEDRLQCDDWSLRFAPTWKFANETTSTPISSILPMALVSERGHATDTPEPAASKELIVKKQLESAGELETASDEPDGFRFSPLYRLFTIRSYTNSDATIHIVSLRRGDSGSNDNPTVRATPTPSSNPPIGEQLEEPMPHHHGEGFDLLVDSAKL